MTLNPQHAPNTVRSWVATLAVLALLPWLSGCGALAGDRLAEGFIRPDASTRPWVYWYWIDEHISRDGITRDLEAMARVGIGEALIGHVSPARTAARCTC